jgi:hypothetical protein
MACGGVGVRFLLWDLLYSVLCVRVACWLQVKVLYVRNLMLSTTEVQILDTFSTFGVVERVKKIKDYAFVHFQSREEAHKAMAAMNGELLVVRKPLLAY